MEYYAREDVADAIVKNGSGREVAGRFITGQYDSRPNVIQFPSDVVQMARRGITSFHYSVEHWSNPMALATGEDYSGLRTGWDLVLDIDSKLGVEEAQLTAAAIVNFLQKYGIKNEGIKFSGRRGFHIVLPWIMFPKEVNFKELRSLYPDVPRIISKFICERIATGLMQSLVKLKGAKELLKVLDSPPSEMSPYFFVEVERNWGNRHMFRAPYSLNEKTWLASVPVETKKLSSFTPEMAKPEKVKIARFFGGEENEAAALLTDALDWNTATQKEPQKKKMEIKKSQYEKKIPEAMFPPCMKLILAGLKDGRKRSVFTLINFLRMCNWPWPEIEERLMEWNKINPLPDSFIVSQIRWSQRNARTVPNCDNIHYFSDIGICQPDNTCKGGTDKITVKNPINYPFRKMRISWNAAKKENKANEKRPPAYSCSRCKQAFDSMKGLNIHLGRTHGVYE